MYLNGIRNISSIDIFAASKLGYTIKLIASSKLISDDEAEISVEPTFVKNDEILAKVDDVFNAIETEGSYTGKTLFYGRGAGMDPTASAVVADTVKIGTDSVIMTDYFFNSTKVFKVLDNKQIKADYYVRVSDDFNIEKSTFEVFEKIDTYYIITVENISRLEIENLLGDAKEILILKIMN